MSMTDADRLRALLGEDIPDGGAAADTLFKDEEIQEYLETTPSINRAALAGWRVKAARLSNLVDTTEGNVQRKFSQLAAAAYDAIKLYERSDDGPTEGRARVGRATRPPVQW